MSAAERFRPSHHTLGRGTLAVNSSQPSHQSAAIQADGHPSRDRISNHVDQKLSRNLLAIFLFAAPLPI